MVDKKNYILIAVSVIILIISIIVFALVPQCILKAGGFVNEKEITVYDAILTSETITIPVKMKRGYSTPSCQTFNSSFSIEELCALAVEYDSNVKFTKINDNQAYLYKEKSGKIIARTALHKVSETEYLNYVLENMYVKGIVFPTHLTSSFYDQDIVLNGKTYNWYAVSFITIDELIDWLNNIGIYTLEVNKQRDTIICGQKSGDSILKNTIYVANNIIAVSQDM